eukprot:363662-Chlamydomonas_euryale.AAC.26
MVGGGRACRSVCLSADLPQNFRTPRVTEVTGSGLTKGTPVLNLRMPNGSNQHLAKGGLPGRGGGEGMERGRASPPWHAMLCAWWTRTFPAARQAVDPLFGPPLVLLCSTQAYPSRNRSLSL